MDSQQFKALSATEGGRLLKKHVEELVTELVDIREIDNPTEVEILARKRASELLERGLLDRMSNKTLQETPKTEYE